MSLCCVSVLQLFILICLVFQVHAAELNTTLIVDASEASGRRIPDTLFGIFFEEINHAGAGGLWAELNIEQGKEYKVVFYVRSTGPLSLTVSLTGSNGEGNLASVVITGSASEFSNWTKVEGLFEAKATNRNSRLQLTTTAKGVIWLDQVSVMPVDTYKGHGFRRDLAEMLVDMKPRFLRFPGGCFVEGNSLKNAFRWKATVGPWEERPGHLGDMWEYWTDDGLGYFEFLQLSEDLDALPIWVFNSGNSHTDQANKSTILSFVQDALDGIEFTIGDPTSKWGSIRAAMGHPKPFDLRYVAVGNEDCKMETYQRNYLKFYSAIKKAYPDIQVISNCDASAPLDHKADLYDYHVYTDAKDMFSQANTFSQAPRNGPKAFVCEHAVNGDDAGNGSLLAGLAEAGFLIGLEKNSDVVSMASYAPLFVNTNNWRWKPDAIVFNSFQLYGTPSYWMQLFFTESSGATLLKSSLLTNSSYSLVTSAIAWQNPVDKKNYIRIKAVNFGTSTVNLKISFDGLDKNSLQPSGSTKTMLSSANVMDENSFSQSKKVVPIQNLLQNVGLNMNVILPPYSLTSLDLLKKSSNVKKTGSDSSITYSKMGREITKEKRNERKIKGAGRKYMQ